jgi:hypothetical protein
MSLYLSTGMYVCMYVCVSIIKDSGIGLAERSKSIYIYMDICLRKYWTLFHIGSDWWEVLV